MEKKTIGSFIAALRKAKGMTQKELAELLNVSDKTISRWERDEGVPDLAMIPVIAEIFNVSCDELLCGERKQAAEIVESVTKTEKQRLRLLKATLSHYKNHTYIAMGISSLGIIMALICNLAFLKARLGFFLGAIFFASSIICQAIFMEKAFFSVEDAELEKDVLSDYKVKVVAQGKKSIGLTLALLGFTFPFVFIDAYLGLSSESMLPLGAIGASVFLMIYAITLYFINLLLIKKGVCTLNKEESEIYNHNHKLKLNYAIVLLFILLTTFLFHQFATSIWGPYSIMKGTTFNDYDSFIEYMEEEIPDTHGNGAIFYGPETAPIPVEEQFGETHYYDERGNEISREEALTRRLEDKNGNVVCEYIQNRSIVSLRYTPKDETILPITVCTAEDLKEARETASIRHVFFFAAYFIECLSVVLVYFKRRAK